MAIPYKSHEAKKFVVSAVYASDDAGKERRDFYVFDPSATIQTIFEKIVAPIDDEIMYRRYPIAIEVAPDLQTTPRDNRMDEFLSKETDFSN